MEQPNDQSASLNQTRLADCSVPVQSNTAGQFKQQAANTGLNVAAPLSLGVKINLNMIRV